MTGLLSGRKALVTGGGAGIGAATCRRFSAEGAKVVVLDRDEEPVRSSPTSWRPTSSPATSRTEMP